MGDFKTYRDESRINWGTRDNSLSLEQINTGSLLRIADAVEIMAKRYQDLIDECDRYKHRHKQAVEEIKSLNCRIAGLKGTITRLKKR